MKEIKCPNCGSPIEEKQLTAHKRFFQCSYCNHSFRSNESDDKENETIYKIIPPTLSEKKCIELIIDNLINSENVPEDIFDSLQFEIIDRKLYPFYVFDLNWSAEWSALILHRLDNSDTILDSRDVNGRSGGGKTVITYGGSVNVKSWNRNVGYHYNCLIEHFNIPKTEDVNDEIIEKVKITDYCNSLKETLLKNVKEFEKMPEGWTIVEAEPSSDVYSTYQKNYIDWIMWKPIEDTVKWDIEKMAPHPYKVESSRYDSSYYLKKNPTCILIPIWEVKCTYKNTEFGAFLIDVDPMAFFYGLPQMENNTIERLNYNINNFSLRNLIVGGGLIILGSAFHTCFELAAEERRMHPHLGGDDTLSYVFYIILGVILLILLIIGSYHLLKEIYHFFLSKKSATEKSNLLEKSKDKRKQAALKKGFL